MPPGGHPQLQPVPHLTGSTGCWKGQAPLCSRIFLSIPEQVAHMACHRFSLSGSSRWRFSRSPTGVETCSAYKREHLIVGESTVKQACCQSLPPLRSQLSPGVVSRTLKQHVELEAMSRSPARQGKVSQRIAITCHHFRGLPGYWQVMACHSWVVCLHGPGRSKGCAQSCLPRAEGGLGERGRWGILACLAAEAAYKLPAQMQLAAEQTHISGPMHPAEQCKHMATTFTTAGLN